MFTKPLPQADVPLAAPVELHTNCPVGTNGKPGNRLIRLAEPPEAPAAQGVETTLGGARVDQAADRDGERLTVRFAAPVTVSAGEVLEAHLLPD